VSSRRLNPSRSLVSILLALLCVCLLLSTATLELTHSHADGVHADCSLCVTAHAVASFVSAPALLVLFAQIAAVTLFARVLILAKAENFALFTRPPPFNLSIA